MSARLRLFEAMERWPDVTFAPLQGSVCHAIESRYDATLLFHTACGRDDFADSVEMEVDTNGPVCIQCVSRLERAA